MFPLFSILNALLSWLSEQTVCRVFWTNMCVEYKESNNDEIISSAEKVVRPWPDRLDRRLRPCCCSKSSLCPSVRQFSTSGTVSWSHWFSSKIISRLVSLHRGRHARIFGWAKSAAYDRRSTSDLWPITHNIGIWGKQKSCVMRVKFTNEWKTILHIVPLKFL